MYKGTGEQTYGGEESVVTTLDPDSNTQMNANANATVRALGVNGALVLGVYEMSGGKYLEREEQQHQTESEQREQMYRRRSDLVTPTLLRPWEGEEAAVVEAGGNEGNNVNINDATVTKVVVANPAGEAPEGPGRAAPAPGSCTATEPALCRHAEANRRGRRGRRLRSGLSGSIPVMARTTGMNIIIIIVMAPQITKNSDNQKFADDQDGAGSP